MTQFKFMHRKYSVRVELSYTIQLILFCAVQDLFCLNSFLKSLVNSLVTIGKYPYLLKCICFREI